MIPVLPDFEQIARKVFDDYTIRRMGVQRNHEVVALIVDELRQVWNARGVADVVATKDELSAMPIAPAARPYLVNLDRAIRKLDR